MPKQLRTFQEVYDHYLEKFGGMDADQAHELAKYVAVDWAHHHGITPPGDEETEQ